MSVPVTINGVTYTYPTVGDSGWGQQATQVIQAIAGGTLQKSGGLFALTAPVDFGSSHGITAVTFSSRTGSVATSGVVRLANTDGLVWRNNTNTGNLILSINPANNALQFNGSDLTGDTLWGTITGTLSNQTDLQSALNAKANSASPSLSGNITIANGSTITGDFSTSTRPSIRGSVGTSTNVRIIPAGAGGDSTVQFNSNTSATDVNVMRIQAVDAASPFRVNIFQIVGGVQGATANRIEFFNNGTLFAGINPLGVNLATDLTTKSYVDIAVGGAGGTAVWGSITGTLSSQTDVQSAINSAANTAVWGSITGTLADQTDVQSALNAKANSASPSLSGTVTFANNTKISGLFNGTTGDTPYIQSNAGDDTRLNIRANTSTSASSRSALTLFGSSDQNNGVFLQLRSFGNETATQSPGFVWGKLTASVISTAPDFSFVSWTGAAFADVAKISASGTISDNLHLTTKSYVDTQVAASIPKSAVLTATVTEDLPSIAAQDSTTFTVTVTGAVVGDPAQVMPLAPVAGLFYTAYVSAADTVTVIVANAFASAIDAPSADYTCLVYKTANL